MAKLKHIINIGDTYGCFVVTNKLGREGNYRFVCRCSCGEEKNKSAFELMNHKLTGCAQCKWEGVTHPRTKHKNSPRSKNVETATKKLYMVYQSMKKRCADKQDKNYGGRGISVDQLWLGDNGFNNFIEWANSHGYKNGLTLERVDNQKGYSPKNCIFATRSEQSRNRRNNLRFKGEIATDVSVRLGGGKRLVDNRVRNLGWSLEKAFTTPIRGS